MKHKQFKCDCNKTGCMFCDGGLFCCVNCGLAEGCLTTDCPGYECYAEKGDDVYNGKIDFENGKWVNKCSPHSPMYNFKTKKRKK